MLLSPKYRRKLTCQENANNSGCANLVEEYILAPHPVEKPSESSSWLGRLHQSAQLPNIRVISCCAFKLYNQI